MQTEEESHCAHGLFRGGSPLSPHHLYAIIAYTDFSGFSTAFSETFRKMNYKESITSVRDRNRKFYFCSRYLREAVTYYGCAGLGVNTSNGSEYGPFYTGMDVVLSLPQFKMGLQGLCVVLAAQMQKPRVHMFAIRPHVDLQRIPGGVALRGSRRHGDSAQ